MAVLYDAESSLALGTGDRSWTHTPSGTPKGVLVIIVDGVTTDQVVGVTYGGNAMTQVPTHSPKLQTGGEGGAVHAFWLGSSILTGARTVAIDRGDATNYIAACYTVTAIGDTYIHSANSSTSTSTATPGATLTITEDAFVAGGLYSGSNAPGSTAVSGTSNTLTGDFGTDTAAISRGTSIKTSNFSYTWSQTADDGTTIVVALADKTKLQYSQANAQIKTTYRVHAQAQVQIAAAAATTYKVYAQAQVRIKQTYPNGTAYESAVLGDGPVAYWRLGEPSGTFADSSGNNHPATASGTPTRDVTNASIATDDGGVSFSTSSDFLTIADHADLDLGDGPFSIEFWAKRTSDTGDYEAIIGKSTGAYGIQINTNDNMMFTKDQQAILAQANYAVPLNEWHHYVFTRSGTGSGTQKWYVDGSNVSLAQEDTTTSLVDNTSDLTLGKTPTSGDPPFLGGLDEISIYKKVLTPTQISAHYSARTGTGVVGGTFAQAQTFIGNPTKQMYAQAQTSIRIQIQKVSAQARTWIKQTYPNISADTYEDIILGDSPSAYWRLGDLSGTSAKDSVGTNHGTYVGSPTLGVAGAVPGRDTAVTFGASKYITVADNDALDLGDTLTIEFWFKRGDSTAATLLQKGTGTDSGFEVWLTTTQGIVFADGAGNAIMSIGDVANTDDWHHIVFTKSGSTRFAYIDGVERTTLSGNRTLTNNTSGLTIASTNAGGNYLNGSLDEVALYKTALTSAQVVEHYKGRYAATVIADSPISYWRLGERNLNIIFDCGFEDAAITTHWLEDGGPHTLDSSIAGRTGTYAARIDITNDTTVRSIRYVYSNTPAAVASFRFRISALPTTNYLRMMKFNGQSYYDPILQLNTDGYLYFYNGGTAAVSDYTIEVNTWYTIKIAVNATTSQGRWSINDRMQEPPGAPTIPDNMNAIYLGKNYALASGAFSIYFDDVVYSTTWEDFPIADGRVNTSDAWEPYAQDEMGLATTYYVNNPTMGQQGAITDSSDTAVDFYHASTSKYVEGLSPVKSAIVTAGIGSLEAWIKNQGTAWSDTTPIGWGDGTNGFMFYLDGTSYSMYSGPVGATYTDTGNTFGTTWHHLVGTYDGTYLRLYIDGVLRAGPTTASAPGSGTRPMRIADYGYDTRFNGSIDEVAAYTTVLTPAQIAAHYAAGKAFSGAFAQAQAQIAATGSVTRRSYAQAQTQIKQTYLQVAQAQLQVKQTYREYAQARAQVKATYRSYAQAQTQIKNTYRGYAQANALTKRTYYTHAQAQVRIKQTYQVVAQAQTKISTTRVHAQAQTQIKQTYRGYAQGQAHIKQTYRGYAQAGANIKQTYQAFAQSNSHIRRTEQGYSQANAAIKITYYSVAQSQAHIKSIEYKFAQANATIKGKDIAFAQALADIKQTYPNANSGGTLVVYSSTSDGFINSTDGTIDDGEGFPIQGSYATALAGSPSWFSDDTLNYGYIGQDHPDTYTYVVQESFLSFDTSSISDSDAVSAAVLRVYAHSSGLISQYFDIQARLSDWGTSLGVDDWKTDSGLSALTLLGSYSTASGWTINSGYDLSDTAMAANVSKTGSTRLLLCSSRTVSGSAPSSFEYVGIFLSDLAGTTYDPKITITYGSVEGPTFAQSQAQVKQTYYVHAQAQTKTIQTYAVVAQANARIKQVYPVVAQANSWITTITFIREAQNANSGVQSGITVSITTPTAGNMLIAAVASDKQATAYTVAGFTAVSTYYNTSVSGGLFYKIADGTETSVVFSQSTTANNGISAWVGEYSGINAVKVISTSYGTESTVTSLWVDSTHLVYTAEQLLVSIIGIDTSSNATTHSWDGAYAQNEQAWVTAGSGGPPGLSVADRRLLYLSDYDASFSWTGTADQGFITFVVLYKAGFAYAQAQTQIVIPAATYKVVAQAQADIKQIYLVYAQAQALIKASYTQIAQSQTSVKTTYYAVAQTQAKINAFGVQQFAQANAQIKQTYRGYSQARTWIKRTFRAVAQAQTKISTTRKYAQAQALLNRGIKTAQANVLIDGLYHSIQDTFTRTVADGWGTADIGGDWVSHSTNYAPPEFSVSSGEGAWNNVGTNQQYIAAEQALLPSSLYVTFEYHTTLTTGQIPGYIAIRPYNGTTYTSEVPYISIAQGEPNLFYYSDEWGSGYIPFDYQSDELWKAEFRVVQPKDTSGSYWYFRTWKIGTPVPDWQISYYYSKQFIPGHLALQNSGESAINQNIYLDNINAGSTYYQNYAQAQASIVYTSLQYAQAQAKIISTYVAVAQSQVGIKQTYKILAQAKTHIKQTYPNAGYIEITTLQNGGPNPPQDEIQRITVNAAGGTWRLTGFGGFDETFAFNASVAAVQAAIDAYMDPLQGFATVTGTPGIWTLTWGGPTFSGSDMDQMVVDGSNLNLIWGAFGQSGTTIKATYSTYAQAQTQIRNTYAAVAQAQTQIKQIYRAFAQAQTNIKQVYRVVAQAQAQIKNTYTQIAQASVWIEVTVSQVAQAQAKINAFGVQEYAQAATWVEGSGLGFAQAQAKVNAFAVQKYAQALASIKQTYKVVAQSNAHIKQVYQVYAQAQGHIKHTDNVCFAQSQASIKSSYIVTAQAQTKINAFNVQRYAQAATWVEGSAIVFAQAQAKINAFGVRQYAQSQAQIKQTYPVVAQARTSIRATYLAYAQANTLIKNTYTVNAQALALIKRTYAVVAQAQTAVKSIYIVSAQAQADIKQTYRVYAQAQAWIENTYAAVAQAQTSIKTSYAVHAQVNARIYLVVTTVAQAQAFIISGKNAHAQAQAQIKVTTRVYAQANAWIGGQLLVFAQAQAKLNAFGMTKVAQAATWVKRTDRVYAQAQTTILAQYRSYAQASATIRQTYSSVAQSAALIKQTYRGVAQAQARIKATYQQYGQAQAKINAFNVQAFAQAQAAVKFDGNAVFAQAQAKLRAFGVTQVAQSQATIKTTYRAHSQARTSVKSVYVAVAQAQARLMTAYQGYANAQANIKGVTTASAQAQAKIKATFIQNAQAVTTIKASGIVHAQAIASIIYSGLTVFAQAQAQIKSTYQVSAQAETSIKTIYQIYGNAQAAILIYVNNYGQAGAWIQANYSVYAQAEALITSSSVVIAQALAHIKVEGTTVFAQALATIIKSTAYAQAQALIFQPVFLYDLEVSDVQILHLEVSDISEDAIEDSDNTKIEVTLSDIQGLHLELTDIINIIMETSDRGDTNDQTE